MDWTNKKIIILGDSITEGAAASCEDNVYHQKLKRMLGLATLVAYGKGGTRIARQTTPSDDPAYDCDFNLRADAMDGDADLVVVFGGTNDFGHGDAPLGKQCDRNLYTFFGACECLFDKLSERYGKNKVLIVTPLHRRDDNNPFGDGSKKVKSVPMANYVDAIVTVAKEYGLKVLDLWNEPELNLHLSDNARYFADDGLHPNDDGHLLIAKKMATYLKNL